MVINLNESTARQLSEAASSAGMTIEEFVRTHLLSAAKNEKEPQLRPIVGVMATDADLLDEVVADAYVSRERDPFRADSDG